MEDHSGQRRGDQDHVGSPIIGVGRDREAAWDNSGGAEDNGGSGAMISASIFLGKKLIARMSANSQTEILDLTEVASQWLMMHYKVMCEQLVIKFKQESVE